MRFLRVLSSALVAGLMMSPLGALAESLPTPKNKPILEIAGSIGTTNKEGVAVFDREMLESLGMETITTTTPWHKGWPDRDFGPGSVRLLYGGWCG